MAIIGIDLGTSNTLSCVFQDGRPVLIPNRDGSFMTPSVVSLTEDGSILVGKAAKERLLTHPDRTAASYKIFMGSQKTIPLGEKPYSPEELSALVLRQVKEDAQRFLGEEVDEAVISVPAYFNDDQRCATKLAAELAGLKVSRLINEPSAAAVYHRWHGTASQDGKRMIVDFGGGTLDVSIVECFENIIEIQAIAGDNQLGGDDVDRAIADWFCQENGMKPSDLSQEQWASLMKLAEQAKQTLSTPGCEFTALCLTTPEQTLQLAMDRALLAQLCAPLFRRVEKVLRRVLGEPGAASGIQQVVLVGGSAHLTVFQDFLQRLTSVAPVLGEEPDYTVALGAGLCAGIKERREELQDIVMTDVCPFSLGVATYNSKYDQNPHMAVLLPRSSMLPASHSSQFYTLSDGQTVLKLEIYQGECYFVSDNLKLGELTVPVPQGPAGSQWAKVVFTYDIDGILHVEVLSSGGQRKETVILNTRLHLTPAQLEDAMERIRQVKLDCGPVEERPLFQKALAHYQTLNGRRREILGFYMGQYSMALDSGELIGQRQAEQLLEQLLTALEEEGESPFLTLLDQEEKEEDSHE